MWKVPAAVIASVSAAVIASGFAPAALASPAVHRVQAPSQDPTAAPDPHASMPGMDPEMPGMTHDQMPGMDPDMPGMTHEDTPGMDPDMPGMEHGTSASNPNASPQGSTHAHASGTASESPRPQAAVVGPFVVLNSGVLLTAGLISRRAKLRALPSRASRPGQ